MGGLKNKYVRDCSTFPNGFSKKSQGFKNIKAHVHIDTVEKFLDKIGFYIVCSTFVFLEDVYAVN